MKSIPYTASLAAALALAAGALQAQVVPPAPPAAPAASNSNQPLVMQQMVVTSARGALISAQEIKQNSSQFVDSVVAMDIGKLPDNTVAEALQRVPGVQVAYSGGEVSSVVIRGLPNLETTLNGYEVFTGTGRGVALQDLPAEMVAGIDVYKTRNPDQIEGGVAGSIDVRLHRPFDFDAEEFALTAQGYYSDQSRKDSFNLSALASDRWKTANGELGVLFDLSFHQQRYEDQVADNYVHFGANGETFDLATDSAGNRGYYADNYGLQLIPGIRTRPAASLMLQWKNNSGLELYWDNLFTGYRNDHNVDFFIGIPSFGGTRTNVVLFPAGIGGYNVPEHFDNLGTPARFVQSLTANNTNTIASKQAFDDSTNGYQGAFGGKWTQDRLTLDGELSYDFSTVRTRGAILDTIIVVPTINLLYHFNQPTDMQFGGINFLDPNNYHLSQYFDQWDRDHTEFYALKADALYRLDSPVLTSVQAGIRYSDRGVDSHSANPGSYALPFATLAGSIPGLMTPSVTAPFVSSSQLNVRQWLSADPAFLLNHLDTLRALAGRPLGLPPVAPAQTFLDDDTTFAPYVFGNYKASLGGMALDGVIGLRFSDDDEKLTGYQQQSVNGSTTGSYVKTTIDDNRWSALPTLSGRLKLMDDLQARASFTKTLTRPDFSQLNPAVSLTSPGPTIQGSGSGGNPALGPVQSNNYDVSLEYYPAKSTQMTVAGFYRTINGYIQSYASQETIGGNSYSVTRPRSTHDGRLSGVEADYQQFLDFLPAPFNGLGFQVNYTYIDGSTMSPSLIRTPLAQVSRNNYNAVLIYEKGPFTARLGYNWRDKYIDSFSQPGIQPTTVWVQSNDRADFSASYALTKNLTLTFDATNILGHWYHDNFGDLPVFTRDTRNYDKTYGVGLRYKY